MKTGKAVEIGRDQLADLKAKIERNNPLNESEQTAINEIRNDLLEYFDDELDISRTDILIYESFVREYLLYSCNG